MAPLRLVALVVLVAACGEPLRPPGYGGEPRFLIRGLLSAAHPRHFADGKRPVSYGVFWNPRGTALPDTFDGLVEQPASSRVLQDIYWPIDEEPEAADLVTTPSGARYGLGFLLSYDDLDANGRHDAGEPFWEGGGHVLLFAPDDLATADSPTGVAIAAGWHLAVYPFRCSGSAPAADGACGVPLGAACTKDDECMGGLCGHAFPPDSTSPQDWRFTFPNGACVMPDDGACRPRGGALVSGVWLQGCAADADCARSGYHCDVGVVACLSDRVIFTPLKDTHAPPALCLTSP